MTHRRNVSQRGSVEVLEQVVDVVEGARARARARRGLAEPAWGPQLVAGVSGGVVVPGEGIVEVVEVAVGAGPADVLLISQRQVHPIQQLGRLVHRGASVQVRQRRHDDARRFVCADKKRRPVSTAPQQRRQRNGRPGFFFFSFFFFFVLSSVAASRKVEDLFG